MIQAIQTLYKGYRFRSRLEARWAVFFDALGIEWEYEPQGYRLPDGTVYLPDFWLPGELCYVEVKPIGGDFGKAINFATAADTSVWLAEGPPDFVWWCIFNHQGSAISAPIIKNGAVYMWIEDWAQGFVPLAGITATYGRPPQHMDDLVYGAILKARQARFEHGETPQ